MMLKQEERHGEKQSTIQRYEFHFTSIQRTSSITYFAVRKTTQHKLPQLKLGPTIYAIGPPVLLKSCKILVFFGLFSYLVILSPVCEYILRYFTAYVHSSLKL